MSSIEQDGKSPSSNQGPSLAAFLSLGFRPLFLGAALFAILSIGLWALALHGIDLIEPGYGIVMWHTHEMVFGYGSAVLSGFLLTAVPNWTGRQPLSGLGLGALCLLWLAGRGVMMVEAPQSLVIGLNLAFLPIVLVVMTREIIAARNWRNMMVLGPIALFALANGIFHFEAVRFGYSEYGVRLGMAALVFLIMLIGGRIVPAFSRNWLVKQGAKRLPVGFARLDGVILLGSVVALMLWVLVPVGLITALLLCVIALLHGVRMARWAGWATRGNPLLFVLHAAYAMIPAGLALLALGAGTDDVGVQIAALHLLGIGAIGTMTLAVMIRASLGHTGRALRADRWLMSGLALIFAAAIMRVLAEIAVGPPIWTDLSAVLWMAGFALFILRIGPSLLTPRPGPGQV